MLCAHDQALLDALDFHKNVRLSMLETEVKLNNPAAAAAITAARRAHEANTKAETQDDRRSAALLEFQEQAWYKQTLQRQPSSDVRWSPSHRSIPQPEEAEGQARALSRLQTQAEQERERLRRLSELRASKLKEQQQRARTRASTASQACLVGSDRPQALPPLRVVTATPDRLVPEIVLRRARSMQSVTTVACDASAASSISSSPASPPDAQLTRHQRHGQPYLSRPAYSASPSRPCSAAVARKLHSRAAMYLPLR